MEGKIISNCATENAHTGTGGCPVIESYTTAVVLTDYRAKYPADPETFKSQLDGYVLTDGLNRIFPIKDIIENTLTGGDVATSEVGFGGARPTGLNAFSEVYRVDAGSCLFKEMAKMNGRKMRAFRVDSGSMWNGTIVAESDKKKYAGFTVTPFAYEQKATDRGTPGGAFIALYYSADYENEIKNKHAFVAPVPDGLLGVTLEKGSTSGTAKVVESCGGSDLTTSYEWKPEHFVNNTGGNPTTITLSPNGEYLTFAPVTAYKVAAASVLQADNIYGLEGVDAYVSLT